MVVDVHKKLIVAHNLKATKEQIVDDLNGVMSSLQRWMMEKVLRHLGELNVHVKELDHAIDDFIMPKEKRASKAIQDVIGMGTNSTQATIAVIGTDISHFPTDGHISSWAGSCPGDNKSAKKTTSGKTRKGNALLRETVDSAAKNPRKMFA
ncbi:MAG: transposase [Lachnospiraceae bacterium]|nr:transposase [Lachnospiraceae bacterium]